ncbi:hypothetical protein P3T36_007343 [Kitasatospora sp. MAP12-15]|uniref:hypothetical protein n=1 Tax=unclassified Kitasatospora TaxID=2633591 RepID=UPI0024733C81|nr:hypothetical protein [Kitasatospora sp. MAP12-44]MDH6115054.1 hypothetical protein [Kitasatospora sp. MAP12-44]
MDTAEPFVDDDSDHDVCWFCPSLRFPAGGFDVFEQPSRECPFDPADGFRYTAARVPVCVHPYKVGLPPGRYGSDGEPVPARALRPTPPGVTGMPLSAPGDAEPGAARTYQAPRSEPRRRRRTPAPYAGALPPGLPQELADLAAWVGRLANRAAPTELAEVLAAAEAAALTRFPEVEVLAVMRRVLSGSP